MGLMIYEGTTMHKQVSESVLCTYQSKEELNYTVNVNSTKLYDQKVVPEGQYYVSNYADSIRFNYINNYTASVDAEVQGEYKITAEFRGYTTEQGDEGEKKVTVWSKNQVLKDTTKFNEFDNQHNIDEEIALDLKVYSDFIKIGRAHV